MEGGAIMAEDMENENLNERDLETWEEFNKELEER